MKPKPDKLFRHKLHDYEMPVRPEAWQRVSQKINKPTDRRLWFRMAAAILVLAVAGLYVLTVSFKSADEPLATAATSPENAKVIASEQPKEERLATENKQKTDEVTEAGHQKSRPVVKPDKKPQVAVRQSTPTFHRDELKTEVAGPVTERDGTGTSVQEIARIGSTPIQNKTLTNAKSITIVFSAEEVNEKYLTKKELTEATSEGKESSTLKKLLDKAYDLTHNQDPIGELRQKKNEILARNFRNDKQRNENN